MSKLRSLGPLVRKADLRTTKPPPSPVSPQQRFKRADPFYASPEFRAWRAKVVARAGGRCEAIVHGQRCTKAQPMHRMFADHIVEIKDGGELFGPGQCLCGPHHLMKTAQTRRDRLARRRGDQEC
jgi:5-methylcytosine-specific restriction protein A